VRELAPKPYAALNAQEARSLGAEAGQLIRITADTTTFELPLKISGGLPDGILGLPSGLPDFNAPSMPVPVRSLERYEQICGCDPGRSLLFSGFLVVSLTIAAV